MKSIILTHIFLIAIIGCKFCEQKKEVITFFCEDQILFEFEKNKIIKQDTFNYEEGKIYTLTTSNSSTIMALCGGNASLAEPKNYTLIDSTMIGNYLNKVGVDNDSGLYWRKYKNLMYFNVPESEILFFNKIIDNASPRD